MKIRDIVITFEFGIVLGIFGMGVFYYISKIFGNIMVVIAICIYFVKALHLGSSKENKEKI